MISEADPLRGLLDDRALHPLAQFLMSIQTQLYGSPSVDFHARKCKASNRSSVLLPRVNAPIANRVDSGDANIHYSRDFRYPRSGS